MDLKKLEENKIITMCILKGMSNIEIAKKLNYSRSTIAYKIKNIFKRYNTTNRFDFAITILSEVILKNKEHLEKEAKNNYLLQKESYKIKKLLSKVLTKLENSSDYEKIKNQVKNLIE